MRSGGARSQNKRETQRGKCWPPTAKATLQQTEPPYPEPQPGNGYQGRGPGALLSAHFRIYMPSCSAQCRDPCSGPQPGPPSASITKLNCGFPGNDLQGQHPPQDPQRACHTPCSITHSGKKAAQS